MTQRKNPHDAPNDAPQDARDDALAGASSQDIKDLVQQLAQAARGRGWRLGTAESCTGGLIAAACTAVAGSSDWFDEAVVSYSNAAKTRWLDVPAELIARDGAVSEAVARAMAQGLLERTDLQLSVAVTGIAGPSGGSPGKPVGTVWLAWAWRETPGATCTVHAQVQRFGGDRATVRRATVVRALQGLIGCCRTGAP